MKKLFTSIRSANMLFAFAVFSFFPFKKVSAQCPGGYTQSQLNWDYLDFLPTTSPTYYTPFYVSGITPYNQNFSMGTQRVNFAMSPAANITLDGENLTNTADAGSFATPGFDVQFTTTNAANTTIVMTFDAEVANVKFSLFDIDQNQAVTIGAANTLLVPQLITVTKVSFASGIVIVGSPGITPVATGPGANYNDANTFGTVNVSIPGPVKTIVILLNNAVGDIWLSDIDACVTGSFPNNWRNISRPFTGMPSYILTVKDSVFYILDPATGKSKVLYKDPGNEFINGMAYDPYNRLLYYNYTQTGTATRTIYKYDINTEAPRTVWVADVNTAPLNIPTYTQGVESAAASFYNGYYYFGVEGNKTAGPGSTNQTGRENTIWRIELDAAQNPVRASQVYATRVDSLMVAGNRLIHDWSDIGVTNNGMMYDFDGAPSDPNFYHFNMMTGQRVNYGAPGTGFNVPRQVAVDWQENVYNMGNAGTSPSDGFIIPYNYNGTVNGAQNQVVTLNGTNLNGNFGDCSEAFRPLCDFGDAPASYDPDPLSPAVHEKDTAIRIGATWDREWLKTSSVPANADGADEDGLAFVPIFSPTAGDYLAQVSVYNNTGGNATLIAWLDFNGNGLFDTGEACQTPPVVTSMASAQNRYLYWPSAPTSLPYGSYTYLRIRLVKASAGMTNSNPTGYYDHGETEDYRILVDSYPLTVNLLSFNAKVITTDNAELSWKTTEEENFTGFAIERSADNNNWVSIGMVNAKGNGLAGENNYLYNDLNPLQGKSYYRLKLISGDGKNKNSEIRTITIKTGIQQITLSPNPATNKATLLINTSLDATASITVTDISGKAVYKQIVAVRKGINAIDLPVTKRLSSGMYFVLVDIKNELITKKLIIRK
jgi:GEVED domain/Secretion system C-terminal sorting domain